jgi:hypothetical protein
MAASFNAIVFTLLQASAVVQNRVSIQAASANVDEKVSRL